ncbi:hypothetical protein GN958_ATG00860 [Phytophthora infestans]|uniref:Uncharacterized protein n=1 Tax=Phytophthora infestans TaxID=4787 RepID=A0A8S9VAN8_PHYIN|nr:hypothetical protein GN958_ATG02407 [Phytophthora infestans]KAF4149921.1 hypothetical protein GN958_ATG00860 [Phytophthora infestans]
MATGSNIVMLINDSILQILAVRHTNSSRCVSTRLKVQDVIFEKEMVDVRTNPAVKLHWRCGLNYLGRLQKLI